MLRQRKQLGQTQASWRNLFNKAAFKMWHSLRQSTQQAVKEPSVCSSRVDGSKRRRFLYYKSHLQVCILTDQVLQRVLVLLMSPTLTCVSLGFQKLPQLHMQDLCCTIETVNRLHQPWQVMDYNLCQHKLYQPKYDRVRGLRCPCWCRWTRSICQFYSDTFFLK